MVAEALARLKGVGRWQRVAGITATVREMPFERDFSFDRVLGMHMLYHAEDKQAAIGEIARVLKPGGVALITTNGAKNMGEADALKAKAFGFRRGRRSISPSKARRLCSRRSSIRPSSSAARPGWWLPTRRTSSAT